MRAVRLPLILAAIITFGIPDDGWGQTSPVSGTLPVGSSMSLPDDDVGLGNPDRPVAHMILDCAGPNPRPALLSSCQDAALAVVAARGALGLASAGGNDVPGFASTLGKQVVGGMRFSASGRIGTARAKLPSTNTQAAPGSKDASALVGFMHVQGLASVFDGFSLDPSTGGILALDLMASGQFVSGPSLKGFKGGILGAGGGARLGIIRESFTLPGVSLSVNRRFLQDTGMGGLLQGDAFSSNFDMDVTSLRAVVGKDVGGFGIQAGLGQDRYRGEASIAVWDAVEEVLRQSESSDLVTDRPIVFAGATYTILSFQLSMELGWAGGYDLSLPAAVGSGYDPDSSTVFGSVAGRLSF
jgi:hypothetical protein